MRVSSVVGWVLLAILGLAVAAAVSFAASQISSQRIGLSSEPLTAGERLAPVSTVTTRTDGTTPATTTPATTTPATTTTAPGDDHSGSGGSGRADGDHDADDD